MATLGFLQLQAGEGGKVELLGRLWAASLQEGDRRPLTGVLGRVGRRERNVLLSRAALGLLIQLVHLLKAVEVVVVLRKGGKC